MNIQIKMLFLGVLITGSAIKADISDWYPWNWKWPAPNLLKEYEDYVVERRGTFPIIQGINRYLDKFLHIDQSRLEKHPDEVQSLLLTILKYPEEWALFLMDNLQRIQYVIPLEEALAEAAKKDSAFFHLPRESKHSGSMRPEDGDQEFWKKVVFLAPAVGITRGDTVFEKSRAITPERVSELKKELIEKHREKVNLLFGEYADMYLNPYFRELSSSVEKKDNATFMSPLEATLTPAQQVQQAWQAGAYWAGQKWQQAKNWMARRLTPKAAERFRSMQVPRPLRGDYDIIRDRIAKQARPISE